MARIRGSKGADRSRNSLDRLPLFAHQIFGVSLHRAKVLLLVRFGAVSNGVARFMMSDRSKVLGRLRYHLSLPEKKGRRPKPRQIKESQAKGMLMRRNDIIDVSDSMERLMIEHEK